MRAFFYLLVHNCLRARQEKKDGEHFSVITRPLSQVLHLLGPTRVNGRAALANRATNMGYIRLSVCTKRGKATLVRNRKHLHVAQKPVSLIDARAMIWSE